MLKEKPLGTNFKAWTVSQSLLATILNVTSQRINQLITDGVIVRTGNKNGAVYLVESLKNFYENKYGAGDLKKEKTLHERAKRELTELKLQKAKGELYPAAVVENFLAETLTNFRNKLSGVAAKFSLQLEGKTRADINRILNSEIENLLNEIADELENANFEEELEGQPAEDSEGG